MQEELDAHYPSSDITIVGLNNIDASTATADMAALNDLPLLQDVDVNTDNVSDVWEDWEAVWRDVMVVNTSGDLADDVTNLTEHRLDLSQESYDLLKGRIIESATKDRVAQTAWQNRVEPLDVNNDGFVSPGDVLANVLRINNEGSGALEANPSEVTTFHDVNGDGFIAPNDVLEQVIHANRDKLSNSGGEPPEASADALFALLAAQQDDD